MNIYPTSSAAPTDLSSIRVEDLAGNKNLTEQQKIGEASRQFEAIMLRQILSEAQKPVITSEFTDNSTAAGIYQDFTTNALADSMSKAGTLGLAKVFEQQLSHPVSKAGAAPQAHTAPVSPILVAPKHP
ncbi:MAG TPA: rod-binding protein [Candidatus Acidoferrum sp.]|nr:rod-binding protein [Candidatus Acidoferrum sp.]